MVPGLLDDLATRGIRLWTEGRHLRFRAPRGALTPDQRALLAQHKTAVVEELQRRGAQSRLTPPVSYNQASLCFVHAMAPHSAAYNVGFAARVRSKLDVPALHEALQALTDRHASLRTTIATGDGEPHQDVHGYRPVDFAEIDATTWAAPALGAALDAEQQRPFDLATGPLFRARLYRRGPGEHVLLMTVHHIVADGWSGWLLLQELAVLYAAHRGGSASALPLPAEEYADYVQWQRDRLAAEGEALWAYWQKRCAGDIPALELPTDRPRPQVPSQRGATHRFALGAEVSQQLRALARTEGTTLYTILLAAFQVLLHRYTAQDDFAVGSPTFGRSEPRFEAVTGHFVNMLVLRADLSGRSSFRAFLGQVRETVLGALAHQDFPFALLVERLGGPRDPSRAPLFQVTFQLQQPQRSVDVGGVLAGPTAGSGPSELVLEPLPLAQQEGQFDLSLDVTDLGGPLQAAIKYSTDLFEPGTIGRMQGHLEVLLAAIVENPERSVSDLPVLTAAEREQIVVEWNRTDADHPGEWCLHRGFEAQVARTPERVAVVCEGAALTYGELNRRANGVARRLRALGVGPEVLVGLCVERSLEMVVGILAILKAGGAYVPLDPTYPAGRLAFMLEDSAVPVLLTQARLVAELPPHRATVVALDAAELTESGAGAEGEDLPGGASPDNLAYVIYTSGSTGQPKGTLITHRNVARLMEATEAWYGFGPADVWTLFHSYAFDFSVWELWGALGYGGRLVVVPYWVSRSPESFLELLEREQVTVLNQTPSAFRQLAHVALEGGGPRALALRYVIFGGEALELQGLRPWFARYGDRQPQLVNMYGITETTVHVTYRPITMADVEAETGSVIGVPIPDLAVYLLDRYGKLVPIGVPGELYVGGAGVGRGYLNRPELTAARFVPDPFTEGPGARLYRSGDRARRLPAGDLEYLGRLDHQVKIRGFRIELGEIEAVLGKHEEVREVAVVARDDIAGRRELVAYIVPRCFPGPPVAEVRHFLKDRLPDYMVPTAVVVLDVLPLTANGKVDRRALPVPEAAHREAADEYAVPTTPLEVTLSRIWAELLGVERIGIHDSFFGLGGDSILILQVIARARQAGLRVTAADMFRNPTIAGLAPFVASETVAPAEQGMLTGPVGLTPIQQWFFELDPVGLDHWNQAFRLAVIDELEPSLLEQALVELVRHHDALRLRYERTSEAWQQSYGDLSPSVPLKVVDVASLPDAEQDAATDALGAEIGGSLSLSDGRLVAAAYVRRGRARGDRVLLAIHHLAVDGVSWRILLEDLERAYAQLRAGQPVALPPKTASFKQWAEQLAAYAQSETVRAEMAYWASVESAERLPVDIEPPGPNTVESARTVLVTFDREETLTLLQKVPAAYQTQLNEVLLTALVQATTEWTGRPALVLDLEGHGRESLGEETVDVSRTVGWFTTIFPVRLEVRTGAGPGEALKAVKEQLRQTPNRGLGYGLLRYMTRDAAIARQEQACGPTDLVFNYLGQFDQSDRAGAVRLTDEPCGPLYSGQSSRHHLVEVNSWIVGGRLRVAWTYSGNVHRDASVERVAARLAEALRALVAHCLSPEAGGYTPSDFPDADLTQEELDAVLETLDEDDGAEPKAAAVSRGTGEHVSDRRGPR